jgi:hypothetical protein
MHDGTKTECGEGQGAEGILPVSPFTAMQFHFGMLLGVDDLEALDGYPRGKVRMHNAWLHGEGVVWGFKVGLVEARGEIQVDPGLGLDGAGRELYLADPSCVNLAAWWEAHQGDFDPPLEPDAEGVITFSAHVVARFRACLARPVPAISEPCSDGARDMAYSRAAETVELLLRAGPATLKPLPYPRLRLLFALRDPEPGNAEDSAIVARRDAIRASPLDDQAKLSLAAFREYAALDVAELQPASGEDGQRTFFPELDSTELLLATVTGARIRKEASGWKLLTPPPIVEVHGRPSHVATATIQELLNGPVSGAGATGGGGGGGGPAPIQDAGGPRFKRDSVKLEGRILTLEATAPLSRPSVHASAFRVSSYDPQVGWASLEIRDAGVDDSGKNVRVELKEEAEGEWIRVLALGTGDWPILGAVGGALVPLAGADGAGEPAGRAMQGNDFVHMWKRS